VSRRVAYPIYRGRSNYVIENKDEDPWIGPLIEHAASNNANEAPLTVIGGTCALHPRDMVTPSTRDVQSSQP